jgi:hypothetical protein
MIRKDRTERDGLGSFEALPGHMIGGTEENLEVLKLIKAVSGPKFVTRPYHIHRAASASLLATNEGRREVRLWQ